MRNCGMQQQDDQEIRAFAREPRNDPSPLEIRYTDQLNGIGPSQALAYYGQSREEGSQNVGARESNFQDLKNLQKAVWELHGFEGRLSVNFEDLCPYPEVRLPIGMKKPKFDVYDGRGDPYSHLSGYCSRMREVANDHGVLLAYFGESLTSEAADWYYRQDRSKWRTWNDMATAFMHRFQLNLQVVPTRRSLEAWRKNLAESFMEYARRWWEQVTRIHPPMSEKEIVDMFVEAQDDTYHSLLMTGNRQTFNEVVKLGMRIEEGLKDGKIMGNDSIRAADLCEPLNKVNATKEAVITSCGPSLAPFNASSPVCETQPFIMASDTQWCATAPQNTHREYVRTPHNQNKRLRRGGWKEGKFAPLRESYAAVFERLKTEGKLIPVDWKMPNPVPKNFNPNLRCAYHAGSQGHDIEKCYALKKAIQELINSGQLRVDDF